MGLVLPSGSRVATSRINFRLLAREAMSHGRRLDIVAPDASARALAASAGLPVFASVGEYEEALDTEDDEKDARRAASRAAAGLGGSAALGAAATGGAAEPSLGNRRMPRRPDRGGRPSPGSARDASTRRRLGRCPGGGRGLDGTGGDRRRGDLGETDLYDAPGAVGASTPRTGEPLPVAHGRRRGRRLGAIAGAVAVLAVIVAPSRSAPTCCCRRPRSPSRRGSRRSARVTFNVRADPTTTSVDEEAAVVPAITVTVPVETESSFPATGKRVERTPAKGAVRWTTAIPTRPYTVPSGTVGPDGGRNRVHDRRERCSCRWPCFPGGGASPSIDCQSSEVTVTAAQPGPDGNVDAGTIRVVPASHNRNVVRVNNPYARLTVARATSSPGSRRRTSMRRWRKLNDELRTQFAAEVEHPSGVPEGTTPFPATRGPGRADADHLDPASLVGAGGGLRSPSA